MQIYIPSAGRADSVRRGTVGNLGGAAQVCVVVPEAQFDDYNRALPAGSRARVLSCPEQGIARTRLWIGQHARGEGAGKFLMLDDDLNFVVRERDDHVRLRAAVEKDIEEMLLAVHSSLDEYAHVGVSTRQGNNLPGIGGAVLKAENTRTLRALAYRTDEFLQMAHGRVDVMEDFDVNLQLLRAGHKNCCLYFWAQDQKMTNAPGGCSTYRTHKMHDASARKLAELHPGFVRLTQKQNKTDRDGFGTRTEVVISWKKAAVEGAARRGDRT